MNKIIECIKSIVDRVYVINLSDRVDRWKKIQSHLQDIELYDKVTRIEAIPEEYGHLGALKSHDLAIRTAIDDNCQLALILEDDVTFNLNLQDPDSICNQILSLPNIPSGICYVGGVDDTKPGRHHDTRQWWREAEGTKDTGLEMDKLIGAIGYIMTGKCLQMSKNRLCDNIRKVQNYVNNHGPDGAYNCKKFRKLQKFHIDNWLGRIGKFAPDQQKSYRLSERIVVHDDSSISDTKQGNITYSEWKSSK